MRACASCCACAESESICGTADALEAHRYGLYTDRDIMSNYVFLHLHQKQRHFGFVVPTGPVALIPSSGFNPVKHESPCRGKTLGVFTFARSEALYGLLPSMQSSGQVRTLCAVLQPPPPSPSPPPPAPQQPVLPAVPSRSGAAASSGSGATRGQPVATAVPVHSVGGAGAAPAAGAAANAPVGPGVSSAQRHHDGEWRHVGSGQRRPSDPTAGRASLQRAPVL
jgi:hypothetical protein